MLSLITSSVISQTVEQSIGRECKNFHSKTVDEIATAPKRYHGKRIRVYGWFSVEFENYSVSSEKNSIWLVMDEDNIDKRKGFNGKKGYVCGIFDSTNTGHLGLWSGAIHSISRMGK